MTGGFIDWAGRVVMLALAGLVTLSIIGSLAAIGTGSLDTRSGVEPQAVPPDQRPLPQYEVQQPERGDSAGAEAGQALGTAAVPASPQPVEATRWLEAISYALLALVGVAALATLLLWRGLRERRRIADALDAIARQR